MAGSIAVDRVDILTFINTLQEISPEFGLILNLSKCELCWPSATPDSFDLITRNWSPGTELLGGYVGMGSGDFVLKRVKKIAETIEVISKLNEIVTKRKFKFNIDRSK